LQSNRSHSIPHIYIHLFWGPLRMCSCFFSKVRAIASFLRSPSPLPLILRYLKDSQMPKCGSVCSHCLACACECSLSCAECPLCVCQLNLTPLNVGGEYMRFWREGEAEMREDLSLALSSPVSAIHDAVVIVIAEVILVFFSFLNFILFPFSCYLPFFYNFFFINFVHFNHLFFSPFYSCSYIMILSNYVSSLIKWSFFRLHSGETHKRSPTRSLDSSPKD
jgi:hypothetical protein